MRQAVPFKARKAAGITAELHFVDLRRTGMTGMGHSSSRAALIYQHMDSDRVRSPLIDSGP
ncbi:hypothetical protein RVN83_14885 [Streptomyces sp. PU10]|uniref:hypothetical protein n=1 Tax=unclassified Streptomyces TaxID=2593676 RepID=UPI0028FC35BE|nr:hypothetical protein [Streptomyces sp. PU10]MDU0254459.1 hypothetical protein [Streptomyces sp. PU10]WSU03141.1 hypothetical protein OG368_22120 [Streptomyces sp. NBC_01124]